jgi:predicted dehydrogenase
MSEAVWQVPGSEDNAVAIFRSPDGLPATYHATWSEWRGYRTYLEVYGTQGMVRGAYAPMQNLLITQIGASGPRQRTRRFYPEIMVREKLKSWQSTLLISFKAELRDFKRMIGGDHAVPLADGYAGLRALEVAAAVRESSRTNEVVRLPVLGRMRG